MQRNLRSYGYNRNMIQIPRGLGFNRRRRRRRGLINRRPPVATTQPQRYGPGRLITNITLDVSNILPNTISSTNLGALLKENLEFTELIGKFNYFKLIAIKVMLRPYNFINTNRNQGVFVLDWHGEPPGDLEKSDNAKYFGPINNNLKTWKFIPPKMVIGTTNTDSAPVDLSQYINTHRFVLPVWLHVFHDFTNQVFNFIIEMVIETRGITMLPASSKLNNIQKQIDIIKKSLIKEEDDKEEEIREDEDKKDKVEAIGRAKTEEDEEKIQTLQTQLDNLKEIINKKRLPVDEPKH